MQSKILYDNADIDRTFKRLAREIIEKNKSLDNFVIVAVQKGGINIGKRIQQQLLENENVLIPMIELNISMHRDDLIKKYYIPEMESGFIEMDLLGKNILLCDDVLFTGRTIRAAMDYIFESGRPDIVQLLVMVDRGHREMPVFAEFAGKRIPTSKREDIQVFINEESGGDKIVLTVKESEIL